RLVLLGMEIEPPPEPADSRQEAGSPLAGKTFVFTGGLEGYTREEARRLVESRGGEVVSSVSKKTSYVVVGGDPGSKLQQAQKFGVAVLNEAEFTDLMTPA
ncbi:MAG: BRCT domain-containing protein, partial [Nitrospiraceae bacterium]